MKSGVVLALETVMHGRSVSSFPQLVADEDSLDIRIHGGRSGSAAEIHQLADPGVDELCGQIHVLLDKLKGRASREMPSGSDKVYTAYEYEAYKDLLLAAKKEYKIRRLREKTFGLNGLFSDPAWDMLLDLFIARLEGRAISVTSACIASCVPTTTALRWISVLEKGGVICRQSDHKDKRRQFLDLTRIGFNKMLEHFRGMAGVDIGA